MTGAEATLLATLVPLSVATLGGVATISSRLGRLQASIQDHAERLVRLEGHEDAHDHWHLSRGDR